MLNFLCFKEMVIDKVNGEKKPRYLAYDIIRYENEDISKKPFDPDRTMYIERRIIGGMGTV